MSPRSVEDIAREIVMAVTPFMSAWEFNSFGDADGERLHDELREALGITEDEWRESTTR